MVAISTFKRKDPSPELSPRDPRNSQTLGSPRDGRGLAVSWWLADVRAILILPLYGNPSDGQDHGVPAMVRCNVWTRGSLGVGRREGG